MYTLRIPAPETPVLEVEARFPTSGQDSIELMLPVWSPGFYRVEDYAGKIQAISARDPLGAERAVRPRPEQPNRWTVRTGGTGAVTVRYRLLADQRSVTTNWVGPELGVLNGPATFITLADTVHRPHQVALVPPPGWKRTATGLEPAPDSAPFHWRAGDYDELVDAPIVARDLRMHSFSVRGHRFDLVDVGQPAAWDGKRAARDLEPMVRANDRVWHDLPFRRYVFLNLFRPGGGGLEHRNSTLLTANASRVTTPEGYRQWLAFVAHEYVHAFNVKRLRPVELGPFDYQHPPRTASLWISEGVTTYLADLALARAGLTTVEQLLAAVSAQIAELQSQPGRLMQTVEQSSLEVWTNSLSGINPSGTTVSYYAKGAVLGFLLDARVRHATDGARSLDDVMRLAYQQLWRRSGVHAGRIPRGGRRSRTGRPRRMVPPGGELDRGTRLSRGPRLVRAAFCRPRGRRGGILDARRA